MAFRDLFQDTMGNLWEHNLRTFLTMFGIAWGIMSIILMVAAGEGLWGGQAKQMDTFVRDIMIIFAGRTSMQAGGIVGMALSYLLSAAIGTIPPLRPLF